MKDKLIYFEKLLRHKKTTKFRKASSVAGQGSFETVSGPMTKIYWAGKEAFSLLVL